MATSRVCFFVRLPQDLGLTAGEIEKRRRPFTDKLNETIHFQKKEVVRPIGRAGSVKPPGQKLI
jgi:hypothetical protein